MASRKYAYYNKGNKIAIVEQSETTSSGKMAVAHCTLSGYSTKDTCEAAGGQWIPGSSGNIDSYGEYTSPTTTVTNGLEIEYSYIPDFNFAGAGSYGTDSHRFIGYGSNGTNLVLFTFGVDDYTDLSSLFQANQKIYIDSGPFEGVHETLSAGAANGLLVTKTPFNATPSALTSTVITFGTDEIGTPDSVADKHEMAFFKEQQEKYSNKYVFLTDTAEDANKGFFKLSSGAVDYKLYFDKRYVIQDAGTTTKVNDIKTEAAAFPGNATDTVNVYNAFYEPMVVHENIDVMQDESFELDLTRAQAKAIVYYLKAMAAEDTMEIEMREYYMALFRNEIGKAAASRKYGPYIAAGHWSMK